MLRKNAWIVALFAALAIVLMGCPPGDKGTPDYSPRAIEDFEMTEEVTLAAFPTYGIKHPPLTGTDEGLSAKFIIEDELDKVIDAAAGSKLQLIVTSGQNVSGEHYAVFGRFGNDPGNITPYPGINTTAIPLDTRDARSSNSAPSNGTVFVMNFDIADILPTRITDGGMAGTDAIYVNFWSGFVVNKIYIFEPDTGGAFVPVTGVSGVPATSPVSTSSITLPIEASPAHANNRTIVWSLDTANGGAGTTGASLLDNELSGINAAGEIKLIATIIDGLADGEDAEFPFTIEIVLTEFSITIGGVATPIQVSSLIRTGGSVQAKALTNGYEVSQSNNNWGSVQIPITLTGGKTLADVTTITVVLKSLTGDAHSYKEYLLLAHATSIPSGPWSAASEIAPQFATGGAAINTDIPISFTIDQTKVENLELDDLSSFVIAFCVNAGSANVYTFTNIVINFAD